MTVTQTVTETVTQAPEPEQSASNFATTYATVSSGVVRVETERCDGGGTGSGALLAPDLVLTAAHVVDEHATVQVLAGDQSAAGAVIGYTPHEDLALVQTSRPLTGHLFSLVDDMPDIGTEVAAIGYPLSGPLSLAGPGVVSAYDNPISLSFSTGLVAVPGTMRTTIPTNQGNSGGPIVDVDGRIVAVVSSTEGSTGAVRTDGSVDVTVVTGIKYSIPASMVAARLASWRLIEEPLAPQSCTAPPDTSAWQLVTAQTEGPDTDAVMAVLFDRFHGINTGDYERAYRQWSQERRDGTPYDEFVHDHSTSYVTGVVILDVQRDADDHLRAIITFTSHQEASFGPDQLDCVFWTLDYLLVPGGDHGWLIHSSDDVGDTPRYEACGAGHLGP